jgi:hypothetical protein
MPIKKTVASIRKAVKKANVVPAEKTVRKLPAKVITKVQEIEIESSGEEASIEEEVKNIEEEEIQEPKPKRVRKPKVLKVGSKRQVFNSRALKTSGGLKKEDLIKSKSGRIVSLRASNKARELWNKRNQKIEEKKDIEEETKEEAPISNPSN